MIPSHADPCAVGVDQVQQFPLGPVAAEHGLGGEVAAGHDEALQLVATVCALQHIGASLAGFGSDHLVEDSDCGLEIGDGGAVHACIVPDRGAKVKGRGEISFNPLPRFRGRVSGCSPGSLPGSPPAQDPPRRRNGYRPSGGRSRRVR